MPDQCTTNEVRRFLENVEHNASLHPDMLALLFATLAQGLQYGVYDMYGERWVAGAVETETKKSDVYSKAPSSNSAIIFLITVSRCFDAMLETWLLHEPPYSAGHSDVGNDGSTSY